MVYVLNIVELAKLSRQEIFNKHDWSDQMVDYMLSERILKNDNGILKPEIGIEYNHANFPIIRRDLIKYCECGLQYLSYGLCEQCAFGDTEYSCEYFAMMVSHYP